MSEGVEVSAHVYTLAYTQISGQSGCLLARKKSCIIGVLRNATLMTESLQLRRSTVASCWPNLQQYHHQIMAPFWVPAHDLTAGLRRAASPCAFRGCRVGPLTYSLLHRGVLAGLDLNGHGLRSCCVAMITQHLHDGFPEGWRASLQGTQAHSNPLHAVHAFQDCC